MQETEIGIHTKDGAMNTFITHPEEGGRWPVILFLMDAPGKHEELHDMARRIGTVGYYVMLPNLHYRTARVNMTSHLQSGIGSGCSRSSIAIGKS